jgi:flagellar hook-length control protein FliK
VVITISPYAESAIEFADTGPPQPREKERIEPPNAFADLLAGLLSKNSMEESAVNEDAVITEQVVSVDYESEADSQIISIDAEDERFSEVSLEESVRNGKKSTKDAFEDELLDIELPQEHLNILISVEHLLTRQEEPVPADADALDNLPQVFNDAIPADQLAEATQDASLLLKLPDTAESASFTPLMQAAQTDSSHAESNPKLERTLPKTESAELPPAEGLSEKITAFRSEPENEGQSRLDEARNRDKRKDKVIFEVRDFRAGAEQDAAKNNATRVNAAMETKMRVEAPVQEMTLELKLPDGQTQAEPVWEAKAGKAFEDMLARELHQNLNGDIVRHASIALRDGEEGTIKLALKPESLGNVKIHLEMAENKITGRIVVESEEALRAFQREIHSLEQAFKDSGFTYADLNLSMSADGRNARQHWTDAGTVPLQTVALRYDSAFDDVQTFETYDAAWYGRGLVSINMLA